MSLPYRNIDSEAACYELLGYFSDTVLFEYDCSADVMRYSANVSLLFRNDEIVREHFLEGANQSYVFLQDWELFKCLLTGYSLGEENGELRLLHPEINSYFWCRIQVRYLRKGPDSVQVIGKITDVDGQKRKERTLLQRAETDGLTGLQNKITSESRMEALLKQSDKGLLFMMDIDNFKQINDTYGHSEGDHALMLLADCIRTVFRSDDVLGRVGGDEMAALVVGTKDCMLAQAKMESLFQRIESDIRPVMPDFSVSVGIARYPEDGGDVKQLHRAADCALYQAKSAGKNRYWFYEEKSVII